LWTTRNRPPAPQIGGLARVAPVAEVPLGLAAAAAVRAAIAGIVPASAVPDAAGAAGERHCAGTCG